MSKPSSRWLPIDPNAFDPDEKVSHQGVEFHVVVSPYDMPEAVRGRYDESRQRFVIEFRYLAKEDARSVSLDDHVVLHIGTQSSRIQGIEVDVKGLGANQIALKMEKAIASLPARLHASRLPDGNFAVTRNVISRKTPELMGELAGA